MKSLSELEVHQEFIARHLGPDSVEQKNMLSQLGYSNMDEFIQAVVPASIRMSHALDLEESISEVEALDELKKLAKQNHVFKSYIGQGYYNTLTPTVILRNILENPAWYTAYTPYQAEISQGRLEALLNFQTMVSDLTGMDIANASLLDEGTAAAEAMTLCQRMGKSKSELFLLMKIVSRKRLTLFKRGQKPLVLKLLLGNPSRLWNMIVLQCSFRTLVPMEKLLIILT